MCSFGRSSRVLVKEFESPGPGYVDNTIPISPQLSKNFTLGYKISTKDMTKEYIPGPGTYQIATKFNKPAITYYTTFVLVKLITHTFF